MKTISELESIVREGRELGRKMESLAAVQNALHKHRKASLRVPRLSDGSTNFYDIDLSAEVAMDLILKQAATCVDRLKELGIEPPGPYVEEGTVTT